jgi:aminopeptidase N
MRKYLLPILLAFTISAATAQTLPPVHHAPNKEFHMSNIVLKFKFDMNTKTVLGEVTETITPFRPSLDSIHLNAVDMSISGVSMHGKPLSYRYDGKILTIFFAKPYGLNDRLTYSVAYSTKPSRGIFFIAPDKGYPERNPEVWSMSEPEDARYWFPCHDYPDDFTASEMIATVPSSWTVISNGILKKVTPADGGKEKTFDWVESRPHVIYLISIIAGKFEEFKDHLGSLPIDFYSDPVYGSLIKSNFAKEPDIVKFYSTITGQPFPWEKLALTTVTDFTWGGEENVSAITLTDGTIHDKDAEPEVSSVGLIAHETAHQWFGDLLTTRSWSNSWLNEGFATYFEALYREHAFGENEFRYEMYNNHNQVIAADHAERRPTVYNRYYDPVEIFGTYIYPRGASMLHMLRFFLGDTLFERGIQYYVHEFKHKNVDTHDFANAMSEATGYNVNWFFDEWLYKAGHPVFDVDYSYDPGNRTVLMHVKQVQSVDSLTPVYKTPVNIQIETASSSFTKRVWIDSLSNTFDFSVSGKPLMVNFDEGHWLLDEVHFPKSAAELTYQLQHDSDVVGRIWAAEQLKRDHVDSAEAPLITAMKDDNFWAVRRECATLLGIFNDADTRKALVAATDDKDSRVQEAAISSLGQFRKNSEIETLLRGIFYDRSNYFVRAAAITAITKVDSEKALHVIYTALDRDSYHEILRTTALRALTKARPAMAHEIAVNYVKYGEPENLRTAGISVLASLDMDHDNTVKLLSKYVSDQYIWVRASAIAGLGKIGDKSVIPLLEERMKSESDGRLVNMARAAIASIKDREN